MPPDIADLLHQIDRRLEAIEAAVAAIRADVDRRQADEAERRELSRRLDAV